MVQEIVVKDSDSEPEDNNIIPQKDSQLLNHLQRYYDSIGNGNINCSNTRSSHESEHNEHQDIASSTSPISQDNALKIMKTQFQTQMATDDLKINQYINKKLEENIFELSKKKSNTRQYYSKNPSKLIIEGKKITNLSDDLNELYRKNQIYKSLEDQTGKENSELQQHNEGNSYQNCSLSKDQKQSNSDSKDEHDLSQNNLNGDHLMSKHTNTQNNREVFNTSRKNSQNLNSPQISQTFYQTQLERITQQSESGDQNTKQIEISQPFPSQITNKANFNYYKHFNIQTIDPTNKDTTTIEMKQKDVKIQYQQDNLQDGDINCNLTTKKINEPFSIIMKREIFKENVSLNNNIIKNDNDNCEIKVPLVNQQIVETDVQYPNHHHFAQNGKIEQLSLNESFISKQNHYHQTDKLDTDIAYSSKIEQQEAQSSSKNSEQNSDYHEVEEAITLTDSESDESSSNMINQKIKFQQYQDFNHYHKSRNQFRIKPDKSELVPKQFAYKKVFKLKKQEDDDSDKTQKQFMCKGGLYIDLDVLKRCGDNIEYSNPNLSEILPSSVSPLTYFRTPINAVYHKEEKYSEIELEENKKPSSNMNVILKELNFLNSKLAAAYIQTLCNYVNAQQIQEKMNLNELNKQFTTNKILKKKMEKLIEKERIRQQQWNQSVDDNYSDNEDDNSDVSSQKYYTEIISQESEIQFQQVLQKVLTVHKSDSQTIKAHLLSSDQLQNSYYIYFQRDNARNTFESQISYYGMSKALESVLFDSISVNYFSLHQGIYNPYHDYYSHLQPFLLDILNYQDRRVNLRTIDNFVIQGSIHQHVLTLKTSHIPDTQLQFMDQIIIHEFQIDQVHIEQLQQKRLSKDYQFDHMKVFDQEYNQNVQKLIQKLIVDDDLKEDLIQIEQKSDSSFDTRIKLKKFNVHVIQE